VHQAIAWIAVIVRVFSKLALENATHAFPQGCTNAAFGALIQGKPQRLRAVVAELSTTKRPRGSSDRPSLRTAATDTQ
jgi:hypothetical protein